MDIVIKQNQTKVLSYETIPRVFYLKNAKVSLIDKNGVIIGTPVILEEQLLDENYINNNFCNITEDFLFEDTVIKVSSTDLSKFNIGNTVEIKSLSGFSYFPDYTKVLSIDLMLGTMTLDKKSISNSIISMSPLILSRSANTGIYNGYLTPAHTAFLGTYYAYAYCPTYRFSDEIKIIEISEDDVKTIKNNVTIIKNKYNAPRKKGKLSL